MAERKAARGAKRVANTAAATKGPKGAAKTAAATDTAGTFTAEEKAAMRERARELKAATGRVEEEKAVREKIAAMPAGDRAMAERIHAIVKANAPALAPKLWYGMPAYAKDGSIVCFFQDAGKFKMRYATLGFSDKANLDEGNVWPNAYALRKLTGADEAKIAALVKKAVR